MEVGDPDTGRHRAAGPRYPGRPAWLAAGAQARILPELHSFNWVSEEGQNKHKTRVCLCAYLHMRLCGA